MHRLTIRNNGNEHGVASNPWKHLFSFLWVNEIVKYHESCICSLFRNLHTIFLYTLLIYIANNSIKDFLLLLVLPNEAVWWGGFSSLPKINVWCCDFGVHFCFDFFPVFLCVGFCCPGTHCIDQVNLRLTEICLPLPPKCWD